LAVGVLSAGGVLSALGCLWAVASCVVVSALACHRHRRRAGCRLRLDVLGIPLARPYLHLNAEALMASKAGGGGSKKTSAKKSGTTEEKGSPAARKAAALGGTSSKGTMAGPSAKDTLQPQRGWMERTATAMGSGTGSEQDDVRRAAVTERLQAKIDATEQLAAALPFNETKPAEYATGEQIQMAPEGAHETPDNLDATASTITESNENDKNGVKAAPGTNPNIGPLAKHRVDSGDRMLTTNQGVPIADNQNSLRAGTRGPTLIEDFILREKITHFDHERIPERVVHARGSGAHGFFECTDDLTDITRAAPFAKVGKQTPVFARFSTVAGERGSADTVRDVRGFAVKFYTDEGNWDLVGNNIPVFFIQDAMKFPDLVHAVKPEPHHQMPQASSAHDTFWDFVSLTPESTHMLMWHMSDRAIPRSYRMMQGFGVHTFRFVNAEGQATLVKFHWTPKLGTHSLVWDEANKIMGADPDFHRRDLWEAIEGGEFPEWELQVQLFTEEQAEQWSFDVLDPTKIVPEELVPLRTIGRMVLNRNPDNFFAETEQIAFCTQHIIPGLDFTNDPLLQGRNFSYLDTQLLRLGGPNFHEIPINAPVAEVHNNQRDGFHRQAINRGRVNYEPNSLAGGCPFQAGAAGFSSFAERLLQASREADPIKLRIKPEKFAEHYAQAALFFNSQTPIEQQHIIDAFRFELTRVQTEAVRERMVSQLMNVDERLALGVASGLGMALPEPAPAAAPRPEVEVERSQGLSLLARPGNGSVATRRIALLVADGMDTTAAAALYGRLSDAGSPSALHRTTSRKDPAGKRRSDSGRSDVRGGALGIVGRRRAAVRRGRSRPAGARRSRAGIHHAAVASQQADARAAHRRSHPAHRRGRHRHRHRHDGRGRSGRRLASRFAGGDRSRRRHGRGARTAGLADAGARIRSCTRPASRAGQRPCRIGRGVHHVGGDAPVVHSLQRQRDGSTRAGSSGRRRRPTRAGRSRPRSSNKRGWRRRPQTGRGTRGSSCCRALFLRALSGLRVRAMRPGALPHRTG
jgi:catalase